jgi:hypothetical protein
VRASRRKYDIQDNFHPEAPLSSLINAYSFLAVLVGFAVVAGLVLLTNKPKWNDYAAFGVIVLGLILTWTLLRPRQTPLMDNAKMVQEMIGSGKPVLLEFQSPY